MMKKFLMVTLVSIIMASYGFSNENVISLDNLTSEEIESIPGSYATFKIDPGTKLALNLFLDGPLLTLQYEGDLYLQAHKTFYLRFTEEGVAFSETGENWKPLSEFVTGELSAGLSINEEGKRFFEVGANLDIR